MSADAQLEPNSLFGKYRIVRLIGKGGMGAVYEAVHTDLDKRIALKILPQSVSSDPLVHARFVREGQLASRIRHPNVVDVTDVGVAESTPYMVMEFLEGEDLGTLLDRARPLPVMDLADIILPVIAAVGAAHDAGVVHRDIKPENVYLANARGGTIPKLLDFGISKVAASIAGSNDLTKTSSLLGTPYYMSPEQVRGAKNVDSRSDLYALGVILYECSTGYRPFEDDNLYNLLLTIVSEKVVPPRQHNPHLPEAFEAVVMKAMARDLKDRYANVYQLGAAILPFASPDAQVVWRPTFENPPEGPIVVDMRSDDGLAAAPEGRKGAITPVVTRRGASGSQSGPYPASSTAVPPGTAAGVASAPVEPKKGPPLALLLGAGILVLIGSVVIARKALDKPTPVPPPIATATGAPSTTVSAKPSVTASTPPPVNDSFTATLRLKMPAGCSVKVNNVAATVDDGKLQLTGPVDTTFYLTVTKPNGEVLPQKVFMAQGFLVPDEWDVSKGTLTVKPPPKGSTSAPAPSKGPDIKVTPAPSKSTPAPGATSWDG
ncbi:MAG: protein kinase [Myxococcales bacterium]|nr:protein kinase [Myxococcales bacterium]